MRLEVGLRLRLHLGLRLHRNQTPHLLLPHLRQQWMIALLMPPAFSGECFPVWCKISATRLFN